MASFKNIENTAGENASYAAYKKLTAQDVALTCYIAKKSFSISNPTSLIFDRDVDSIPPSPTPTPSITPTNSIGPTATPSITPTPTITSTPGLSPTLTPTATNTPAATLSPSPSTTPDSTPDASPSATPSSTPDSTPGASPSVTPTVTNTPSITPTLSVTPSITPTALPICVTADYDIMFSIDDSGSTLSYKTQIKEYAVDIVTRLQSQLGNIAPGIQFGVTTWGTNNDFDLDLSTNFTSISSSIASLPWDGGGTSAEQGVSASYSNLVNSGNNRGTENLIILLSDGKVPDIADLIATGSVINATGNTKIIGIGVGSNESDAGVLRDTSYSPSYYITAIEQGVINQLTVTDISDFIVRLICTNPEPSVTPTPTNTITPTVTATASTTPTATLTATPSLEPTITPTSSITPTVTPSLEPTTSVTPTATPSLEPTTSVTPTATPSLEPTTTPSITPTSSVTPTKTLTPTQSNTPTVSTTPSSTPAITPSVTSTITPSRTPSSTPAVCIEYEVNNQSPVEPGYYSYTDCFGYSYDNILIAQDTSYNVCALNEEISGIGVAINTIGICDPIPSRTPTPTITPTVSVTPTITPTVSVTPTLPYVWNSYTGRGYSTPAGSPLAACTNAITNSGPLFTIYWTGEGTQLKDANRIFSQPDYFSQTTAGYYSNGEQWVAVNTSGPGNEVTDSGDCPQAPSPTPTTSVTPTPTPTPFFNEIFLLYSATSYEEACTLLPVTVYSDSTTLSTSTVLVTSQGGGVFANDGYYISQDGTIGKQWDNGQFIDIVSDPCSGGNPL